MSLGLALEIDTVSLCTQYAPSGSSYHPNIGYPLMLPIRRRRATGATRQLTPTTPVSCCFHVLSLICEQLPLASLTLSAVATTTSCHHPTCKDSCWYVCFFSPQCMSASILVDQMHAWLVRSIQHRHTVVNLIQLGVHSYNMFYFPSLFNYHLSY